MNYKLPAKFYWLALLLLGAGIAITAQAYHRVDARSADSFAAQDLGSLDRRLSALEQRLYTIESNLNRVEQQAIMSGRSTPAPAQNLRDPEVSRLLNEVETLKLRLREVECGVVHLDERTLPAGSKETPARDAKTAKDPCRQNPQTPVRLSLRP